MNTQIDKTQGLVCPECAGLVPVPEGAHIVECPYCHLYSLVQGERGIRRWQVNNAVTREQALETAKGHFNGINKARDLKRVAQIDDVFLVYLPYWHLKATVAGWRFGVIKKKDEKDEPVEAEVFEAMDWNDAALDVSEYGVHRVTIGKDQLAPFDSDLLHAQAMVFEPAESRTDAMKEAENHFLYRAREKKYISTTYFEKFHHLQPEFSIVYYPLWVIRYDYHGRHYPVIVDGVRDEILYGKAPGNVLYRAMRLVGGMMIGNFVLVNGTALMALFADGDDDGLAILLLPLIIGIGLIISGYRAFRYGEEVEHVEKGSRKARLAGDGGGLFGLGSLGGLGSLMGKDSSGGDLFKVGMDLLDEFSDTKRK